MRRTRKNALICFSGLCIEGLFLFSLIKTFGMEGQSVFLTALVVKTEFFNRRKQRFVGSSHASS